MRRDKQRIGTEGSNANEPSRRRVLATAGAAASLAIAGCIGPFGEGEEDGEGGEEGEGGESGEGEDD